MSCGQTKTVVIGTVGAGYAAYLHGNGYEKVNGVSVRGNVAVHVGEGFRQPLARFVVAAQKVSQMGALRHIEPVSYTHLGRSTGRLSVPGRIKCQNRLRSIHS